jgi:hypothetical protein
VATIVTVLPETVQTEGVAEAKLTRSPELAVASTVKGATPKATLLSAPNAMLCKLSVVCITGKLTPAIVILPLRVAPVVFAVTAN